jgi:hypothetical protein
VVVGVPPTVQVLLRVAVLDPRAVGEAATAIVQVALPPARAAVPQVSLERVKSPELVPPRTGAEQLVAEPVPELVKVNV